MSSSKHPHCSSCILKQINLYPFSYTSSKKKIEKCTERKNSISGTNGNLLLHLFVQLVQRNKLLLLNI